MPKTTVAAIIRNNENKILLTRRNVEPFKGQWCLPGGHFDKNENAKDAIIREVREETGLEFDANFLNYSDEIIVERDIHAVVLVFLGYGKGQIVTQESEVSNIGWFSLDEARTLPLAFEHNKILDAFPFQVSEKAREEILTEYSALRSEILKRMDMRQNILIYTLAIAGTMLSFGVQEGANHLILLLYPILALFLAAAWTQNDMRIWDVAQYIEKEIESKLNGINWEAYVHRMKQGSKVRPLEIAAVGVFLITELLTIILAFPELTYSTDEVILLASSGIAFVLTILLIRRRSNAMKKSKRI